jgi:transposase InsO family protein
LSWIFFAQPCSKSGDNVGGTAGLAIRRLHGDPRDDAAARRDRDRAALRFGGVSRAGYYRHWRGSAPREEETALRDEVQRIALEKRRYGHRRIAVELRRSGWPVNKKRVLRIMRQDNLLCVPKRAFTPATTDSRHGFRAYPNLARRLVPTAVNQLWVADITYVRLAEEFIYWRRFWTRSAVA